jgi:coenzyme F420-dependent glucose-6-phosphate dehydrogenase
MYGQVTLCWAESRDEAVKTAHRVWPTAAIRGEASQELSVPAHFEQLAQMVTPEALADVIPRGRDPEPVLEKVRAFEAAGFEHICLHQIGPDQAGFLRFAERGYCRSPGARRRARPPSRNPPAGCVSG